ncbi:MAG: hypothetical protein ABI699_11675, partial [Caldimonas sp.]
MSTARSTSLLDLAIVASVAVVPVLLGVVLLVAVVRPAGADADGARERHEHYLSVRLVAALKTFEPAVLRRDAIAEPLPAADGVLAGLPQCRREWRGAAPWRVWLAEAGLARPPAPATAGQVAARLAGLDAALLAFSTRANPRVEHPLGVDAGRWFAAVGAALATPLAHGDAGRPLRLRCADLVEALLALARSDAAMLEGLAWRGSESRVALARWQPAQEMLIPARQVTRRNPWSGIGGCIYLGGDAVAEGAAPPYLAAARSAQRRLCAMPELAGPAGGASDPPFAVGSGGSSSRTMAGPADPSSASSPSAPASSAAPSGRAAAIILAGEPRLADPPDDSRWSVPPSLQAMLQPLESLRQPTGALYRLHTAADAPARPLPGDPPARPNRIVLDGSGVDVGFSIDLTI